MDNVTRFPSAERFELNMQELNTNPRMITGKYIIDDENNVVPAISLSQWGEWMEDRAHYFKRVVSRTKITSDIYISTVFLGLDHGFPELLELQGRHISEYKPILWETMVFGSELDGDTERYHTREEAIEGHLAMVDAVRATLK